MKAADLKQGLNALWDNIAEGWRHLKDSAAGALTRFKSDEHSGLPDKSQVDDAAYQPFGGWSLLGGDVFEDAERLVVRLELPGMQKSDLVIEVIDDALVVSGQKRFAQESSDGRWRIMQCAYGQFRRVVPLAVPVRAEEARASYVNGVLRVELPKAEQKRRRVNIGTD